MNKYSCDSQSCNTLSSCIGNKVIVIVETTKERIIALPGIYKNFGTVSVDFSGVIELIRLDEFKSNWIDWKNIKNTDILGLRAFCSDCYNGIVVNPNIIQPQYLKTIRDFYPDL